jgi:hypothetical protein
MGTNMAVFKLNFGLVMAIENLNKHMVSIKVEEVQKTIPCIIFSYLV